MVVYHLLGKTGWSIVVVIDTRRILGMEVSTGMRSFQLIP